MLADDRRATDHDLLRGATKLHPATDLDPREDRQVEVDQEQVERPVFLIAADAFPAILGLGDLIPFDPEELRDEAPQDRLVFHEEQRPSPFHRLTILPGVSSRSHES